MLAGLGGSLPGYIDGKQHWEGEETIVSTCKISNTTELSCHSTQEKILIHVFGVNSYLIQKQLKACFYTHFQSTVLHNWLANSYVTQ